MRRLRRLHDELHFTSIFVTHDQQEAIEVADTIAVLNRGRIEQSGIPSEVYDLPTSAFVHRFLGQVNELPVQVRDGRAYVGPIDISSTAAVAGGAYAWSFRYIDPRAVFGLDVALIPVAMALLGGSGTHRARLAKLLAARLAPAAV